MLGTLLSDLDRVLMSEGTDIQAIAHSIAYFSAITPFGVGAAHDSKNLAGHVIVANLAANTSLTATLPLQQLRR
jgi:hypothetical protein